jgi:glycosyltransferase involved in cell wall biosynthesis
MSATGAQAAQPIGTRNREAMPQLSAIVITRNEAANIGACLDSLAFCEERIVVDSGSTDATVEIARAKGARVEVHAWPGFGPQKNYALSLASGAWVLSVDADERVTPKLAAAIKAALADPSADGFEFPRQSSFCGRQMRHSGWYPDYVLRLFRRGKARFEDALVHEGVICSGPVKRLHVPLMHYPVHKLEDALARIDRYSTASAQALAASGRKASFLAGIGHGLFAFLRTYVLRAGFLDGAEGFLLAVANAEGSYYRYMKLWLATRNQETGIRNQVSEGQVSGIRNQVSDRIQPDP